MEKYRSKTRQNLDLTYWVVEQDDHNLFNRGWLTNVGIHTAIERFRAENIDCIVQHDVDRYPVGPVNYGDCKYPIQLSSENSQWNRSVPYENYAGGVVAMTPKHWQLVNGMSNLYEGWGGEDDDLYHRLRASGLLSGGEIGAIRRPREGFGKFDEWHDSYHTKRDNRKQHQTMKRLERMKRGQALWKSDGLNTLKYDVKHFIPRANYFHLIVRQESTIDKVVEAPKNLLYAALGGSYAQKGKHAADLVYSARNVMGYSVTIKLFSKRQIRSKTLLDLAKRMRIELVVCPELSVPYASTRFLCYYKELQKEHKLSKIALVDTNDVVILRNIYDKIVKAVYLVQEPVSFPIEKCPYHKEWISGCQSHGPTVFEEIKSNPMICAGTIFGHVHGILGLLQVLNTEIQKTKCNDQGMLNVLIYKGIWTGDFRIWTHETGPVLSMNTAKVHNIDEPRIYVAHTGDNKKAVAAVDARADKMFTNVLSLDEEERAAKLLKDVDRVLTKAGIPYVVDGGTLIGAVQYGHRIPWDDDMDIYVMEDQINVTIDALSKYGLYTSPSYNSLYHKVWDHRNPVVENGQRHGWPFIDIGVLQRNETHAWEKRVKEAKYSHHVYKIEWILPPTKISYEGFTLSAPRNASAFLKHRFGSRWNERCVYANWDHKLERVRLPSLGDGDKKVVIPCSNLQWV